MPCVDFVADAEHCSVCGGILHAQKSKRRLVTTLEVGTFQAREIRKVCSVDRSHPVMASERLSRLVPRGQGYGYDLIVQVGLARYLRNLQREEIRAELLHENGIVVSEGTISNLCDRFLKLLERLHHYSVPALRAAMGGGYPLHIDATSEHGKGGLFLCLDGWRGWVLHAVKISSENEKELRPAIEKTVSLFGDPIAVVRDLGAAEAGAVDSLRDKGIPDLVCHYHFLGAIGKKLFDDHYAVLRNLLRSSKARTGLRELLRELRQNYILRKFTMGDMGRVAYARTYLPSSFGFWKEKAGRIFLTPSAYHTLAFTNAAKRPCNEPNAGCHYPGRMLSDAPSNSYPMSLPAWTRPSASAGWRPNWREAGRPFVNYATFCV